MRPLKITEKNEKNNRPFAVNLNLECNKPVIIMCL